MSKTGTTARQEFDAKIQAMPLGFLKQGLDTLGSKDALDDAEGLVYRAMAAEYRKRMQELTKITTTEALLTDFRAIEAEEYATLSKSRHALYWALDDELMRRFPQAAAKTEEWLDAQDGRTEPEISYGKAFLTNIQEINA